ncbi:MAG: hypothetical protein K0S35_633 [Geminicoccaceae bacterium]|nr:hypothetical protein [Geminicoccaceae bacterium]
MRHKGEHRSAGADPTSKRRVGDNRWSSQIDGEPCLDDLLADPIMALLWRNDRLEPDSAHATVKALQALVQGRDPVHARWSARDEVRALQGPWWDAQEG